MGNIFAITTPTETIKADASGSASAIFTVTNNSNKPIRGIARAKALGTTQQEWLDVEGEREKDLGAGGTQQFTVNFASIGAGTGNFPFRLDVASATDPDEDFTEGPTVNAQTVAPPPKAVKKGFPLWIIIVIAAAVLLIGGLILFLVMRRATPSFAGTWVNTQQSEVSAARIQQDGSSLGLVILQANFKEASPLIPGTVTSDGTGEFVMTEQKTTLSFKVIGPDQLSMRMTTVSKFGDRAAAEETRTRDYVFFRKKSDELQRTQENAPAENKPAENKLVAPAFGTQITSPGFSNGAEELFYIGTDSGIYSNAQTADSVWLGGAPVKGWAKSVCSAINKEGEVEIFYIGPGTDVSIYHNKLRSTPPSYSWFPEVKLRGAGRSIACGKNAEGRLEIFYVGTDYRIYHNPGGDWSSEKEVGGEANEITVGRNKDGRFEIFHGGRDGHKIYHSWQNWDSNNWAGEKQFLERDIGQIVAVSDQEGELNIFYTGKNDNKIYRCAKIGEICLSETTLPGKATQITAAVNSDGRIEVFYINPDDNNIYHDLQAAKNSDNWSGEMAMGGQKAKRIISIGDQNGRLEIFYVGMDNRLYHNWKKTDGSWSGEMPVPSPL